MEWYYYILIVIVGVFCGFLNTLAGSGSIISLAMLMFMGLPANVANGTNRIAILMQNIVGVSSFKKQKVFSFKEGIWLALPAIVGSVIGAGLAVEINEDMMQKTIGGLLIFLFFIVLYKPDAWVKGQAGLIRSKPSIIQIVIFFSIGLYGGFIQAGVGFFLLSGLVLGAGFDLVKANAIKVFIVLLYTPFALGIFVMNGQVDYKIGLILAAGNMIGAYIAANFAVSLGAKFVRYILLAVIIFASLKFLGVYEMLGLI
ncbi:TSUP family transporter [Labilibaculum sp. A4]|uniref:sulfite exporter TauE/SafE family protein n=1 Tax=Labilibaculum euxinus TaxID=2686357 RepID=UPI000F627A05|nr:sulfite exporter TauE/SafE family protein [Labilibaculum euxinus]MDQ1770908.1 sulfite exporter TauE/SafE family protein [Labilibaculum euxinus]MWN76078.1 TSUP family transporter [Labilibaculum euxinus]